VDAMAFGCGDELRHRKIEELAVAQADGRISACLAPAQLLRVIVAISQMWCANEASEQKRSEVK